MHVVAIYYSNQNFVSFFLNIFKEQVKSNNWTTQFLTFLPRKDIIGYLEREFKCVHSGNVNITMGGGRGSENVVMDTGYVHHFNSLHLYELLLLLFV